MSQIFANEQATKLVKTATGLAGKSADAIRLAGIFAIGHAIRYGNCSHLNALVELGDSAANAVKNAVKNINALEISDQTIDTMQAAIFGFNRENGYFIRKDNQTARSYFVPVEGTEATEEDETRASESIRQAWDNKWKAPEKETTTKSSAEIVHSRLKALRRDLGKLPASDTYAATMVKMLDKEIAAAERAMNA